jgi:hypothetical protein
MTKHSEGCECCGNWPVIISQRCHPQADTTAILNEDGKLAIICAECNAFITGFQTTGEQHVIPPFNFVKSEIPE